MKKIFFAVPKVKDWVGRYPKKSLVTEVTYDKTYKVWDIKVWSGPAGEIAAGRIDDLSSEPTAWTGPQVAWTMARGGRGRVRRQADQQLRRLARVLRRVLHRSRRLPPLAQPAEPRPPDAAVVHGLALVLPARADLQQRVLGLPRPCSTCSRERSGSASATGRRPPRARSWPVWVLAAATVFLGGFKVGLNVWGHSNVIDVGYAGPIGAQRIVNGQSPYGHFPVEDSRPKCPGALADREGEVRERIQTNGRCESANPNGDTYGPMSYIAYIPGYLMFGWSGHWDKLPAAHFTAIAFDLLCLIGLALVGWRFGGSGWR